MIENPEPEKVLLMLGPNDLIGIVVHRYSPAIGGVEFCAQMLAERLADRGMHAEVITTDPTGQLHPKQKLNNVLVRRFPTVSNDDVFFISPRLAWWLWHNIDRYSLIHIHNYSTFLTLHAAFTCLYRRIPYVINPYYHGTGHSTFRSMLHLPFRLLGRRIIGGARQVMCISEAERTLVHKHFGQDTRTALVPCGIDTTSILTSERYDTAPELIHILTVARLEHYKQTELIVKSLPHLPVEFNVVIVGDGPARPKIEQTAAKLSVENRVHILGHIGSRQLNMWYRTADLYVSLSRHESFGLTILEAGVAGATIIASDIPAHREAAGYLPKEIAFFVSPDSSPSDLAKVIQRAVQIECPTNIESWSLPTWDDAVTGALLRYRDSLCTSEPSTL